jgi:hypothetical protein
MQTARYKIILLVIHSAPPWVQIEPAAEFSCSRYSGCKKQTAWLLEGTVSDKKAKIYF